MDTPENIEDLTLEEMKRLQRELNELIIDREIVLAVQEAEGNNQ